MSERDFESHSYLVLGSEGQIGGYLFNYLKNRGATVDGLDLEHGLTEDLRILESDRLAEMFQRYDFVIFLAYDIGGSKYLEKYQDSYDFLSNNLKIMNNTFEALRISKAKFVFSSSQMAKMPHSSYGNLKLIGERITKSLGGISVRFWNVYGTETIGEKSHVISDFIGSAMANGCITMRTDGSEVRDFLHVEDASRAILTLTENYKTLSSKTIDVASFQYTSILQLAETVSKIMKVPFTRGTGTDQVQVGYKVDPSADILEYWQPEITLTEGILKVSGINFDSAHESN